MGNKKEDFFWVVGDTHLHFDTMQYILEKYKPNRVIWLGDEFDSFLEHQVPLTREMGKFLKKIIVERPQDSFTWANHSVSYAFPSNEKYKSWGWSAAKQKALDEVFPKELWNKFKIFHTEDYLGQKLVFSHAGFVASFLPNGKWDEEFCRRVEKETLARAPMTHLNNPWFDSMHGPMWKRFPLDIVPGISQICGHTPGNDIRIIKSKSGPEFNICADCLPNYILKFTQDGIFKINLKTDQEILLKECFNDIKA